MTHYEVLQGNYKLVFAHAVPMPTTLTDFDAKGLKIWYVDDGFIAIAPKRIVPFEECIFYFMYPVKGNTAYLCTFDEIKPSNYRMPRNSGTVQISGNKNAVPLRRAIAIVYKELNKAVKCYARIRAQTKIHPTYLNNRVFKAAGRFLPVSVYDNTVYTLHVDFRALRAEYKPLISQSDIIKLYTFVDGQNSITWSKSFGFTQKEFISLVENSDK